MCTVTIVPRGDGFCLRCNRDERRNRPPALPPFVHRLRWHSATFPEDPAGPGTWVGVNSAGVAAALLNRASGAEVRMQQSIRSRGLIIPALLEARSLPEALDIGWTLEPLAFKPFRVVVAHAAEIVILSAEGRSLSVERTPLSRPMMLASSSLGDGLVDRPRRQLFDRMLGGDPRSWLRAQRDFHRHQWPHRPDISVMMERPDARTLSRTVVTVNARTTVMRYRAFDAGDVGFPSRATC
jgi:hypothetical protein